MKTGFKLGSSDGIASLMQSKLTSRKIKLSNIVKDEYQVRSKFNDETIELLADNINRYGLMNPISVYETEPHSGQYKILAGERRYRACELLGFETIDVNVVEEPKDRKDLLFMQFSENLQREDLDQFDIANQIKNLVDLGLTQSEIAKGLNKKDSFVSRHLALLDLPKDVKLLAEKNLASSEALINIKNAHKINPDAVNKFIKKVIKEKSNVTTIDSRDVLAQVRKAAEKAKKEAEEAKLQEQELEASDTSAVTERQLNEIEGLNDSIDSIVVADVDTPSESSEALPVDSKTVESEEAPVSEVAPEVNTEVGFFKRVHATKLLVKVEFYSEDMEDIATGFIVTDRVPYDESFVYVATVNDDGELTYHYVPVKDVDFKGLSESDKILKS